MSALDQLEHVRVLAGFKYPKTFEMARVLIAEDDPTMRVVSLASLKKAGHNAAALEDGVGIFQAVPDFAPDAIVTDIVMEDVKGIEVILLLKEKFPELPVIAISGDEPYLQSAEVFGANAILQKPLAMD